MGIKYINGFTCDSRFNNWRTGTLCLLLETNKGLTLVDTGLGLGDYQNPTLFTQFFRFVTIMPFNPQEAVVHQIQRLGYKPNALKHIILTHMHFDHCGGMADFPQAKVHVYRKEYEAFTGKTRGFLGAAYIQRHIAHQPDFIFYEDSGEKWFDFDAIRIKGFDPEMWFIPMPYHSRGLCGVAIMTQTGWHFHCSDAAADFNHPEIPAWAIRLMLGPYMPRLRKFSVMHPEIKMTASHMFREFFKEN
jgi:glyoxylase-like metal-dependent hydrolase (beta-lactamase superfamily II)